MIAHVSPIILHVSQNHIVRKWTHIFFIHFFFLSFTEEAFRALNFTKFLIAFYLSPTPLTLSLSLSLSLDWYISLSLILSLSFFLFIYLSIYLHI